MSLSDIFRVSEIKKENEKLHNENEKMKSFLNKAVNAQKENEKLKETISQIGGLDYIQVKDKIAFLKDEEKDFRSQLGQLRDDIKNAKSEIKEKKDLLISLDEDFMLESFALYKPHFSFQNSSEYKSRLDRIREDQKQSIKNNSAAFAPIEWTVNNSKSEGKKFSNNIKKLLIRSFNNECDSCVDNVKFNTIETNEKRINAAFDTLNKLGQVTQVSLSNEYKNLKLSELYLAFEYQRKKQDEKEEQRRLKEELREQQKLEQEIAAAREKIAKERSHFSKAIEEINNKIAAATSEDQLVDLNSKLDELQAKNSSLDQEENLIDYREKNAKAGYVYVISNIGAFGKNIFKIGMTRRLEPADRVYELGTASVPFPFDTHAMIFSDNAPELEAKIHQHFYKSRINKINNRKEFFTADIDEVEKVIKENYNKVVDFIKSPSAEQYRESLLIKE